MAPAPPTGLHHVTCVCNDWEATTRFYQALGFVLVKNTVNHDAPESRHIYHAAPDGAPGTTITFFEWPSERQGRPGLTSAHHVGLVLPAGMDLAGARDRLSELGAEARRVDADHGPVLETRDPDRLPLRLHEGNGPQLAPPGLLGAVEGRASFYGDVLGLKVDTSRDGPARVLGPGGTPMLGLLESQAGRGRIAPGAVHHVALGTQSPEHQLELRERLAEAGYGPTEPIDRVYFRSVYLRDPGGHILELATPGPGFTVDEPAGELGERFVLPPWLQDQRDEILATLDR